MKTLRQELTDIILKVSIENYGYPDEDNAHEAAWAVIARIVERLPEKKVFIENRGFVGLSDHDGGWNAYHDTLKDLLTEGKE